MLITYPDSNNLSVCAACEESLARGCGAHGRWQDPSETKVAHNFPRSLFETIHKRCNSNDMNSWFEVAAGELRAKSLSSGRGDATHSTPRVTGVEGAGGSEGLGCGARGRWQGLAGQRVDAPSEARSADGERAGRRPRAHQADRYQQVLLTATRNLAARHAKSGAPRKTWGPPLMRSLS